MAGTVRVDWPGTHWGLFPLQLMMQYLYYGGTESMEIPTADILEVRNSVLHP